MLRFFLFPTEIQRTAKSAGRVTIFIKNFKTELQFMKKKSFYLKKARQWIFAISAFMLVFAVCKNEEKKNDAVHAPNRSVELAYFKSDSERVFDTPNPVNEIKKINISKY
jgi:hypothetical protein